MTEYGGPVYLPSDHLRAMSWRDWKRMGGCSPSDVATRCIFVVLGRDWEKHTIGEITDASALAGRQVARFAHERFGMQVRIEYPAPTERRAPDRNPEPLPLTN